MKPKVERRKDPVVRYLWGQIFYLEEKIKKCEEACKQLSDEMEALETERAR